MTSLKKLAQIRSVRFDIEEEAMLNSLSGLEREILLTRADLKNL